MSTNHSDTVIVANPQAGAPCKPRSSDHVKLAAADIQRKPKLSTAFPWYTVWHWVLVIAVPFIILVISFSFISQPEHFFSKNGGIHLPDMIGFLPLPILSVLGFVSYLIYRAIQDKRKRKRKQKKRPRKMLLKK